MGSMLVPIGVAQGECIVVKGRLAKVQRARRCVMPVVGVQESNDVGYLAVISGLHPQENKNHEKLTLKTTSPRKST